MSAQGTKSSRVLFIGIVQDGKVVQERAMHPGEEVTVGTSPKASFQVADTELGHEAFPLFVVRDGHYRLRFTPAIKGKITSHGEKVELAKAVKDGSAEQDAGVFSVPLVDADKGKIKVGPATLLFKFVDEPQAAPVPAPVAPEKFDFRASWFFDDEDPIFSVSLAFWASLALVFAIWVRTTEPPAVDVEKVAKRVITIAKIEQPKPVEVEDKGQEPEPTEDAVAEADKAKVDEKPVESADKAPVEKAARVESAKADLREQSALFRDLQARLLGTTGESGSALVASASDYAGLGANLKAAEEAGRSMGEGGIRGGTIVAGASGDKQIGGFQQGADTSKTNLGKNPEFVPKGSVKTDDLDFGGADVTDVQKAVRTYSGQLKYCYETSLKANPSLAGRIVVAWTVVGGAATNVDIVENSTRDSEFADCIVRKIRRWSFPGAEDGEAKTTFSFSPQD